MGVPLDVPLDVPRPLPQVIPLGASSHCTAAQDMKQFLLASLIGEESLLNLMTHGLAGVLGKIGLCSALQFGTALHKGTKVLHCTT